LEPLRALLGRLVLEVTVRGGVDRLLTLVTEDVLLGVHGAAQLLVEPTVLVEDRAVLTALEEALREERFGRLERDLGDLGHGFVVFVCDGHDDVRIRGRVAAFGALDDQAMAFVDGPERVEFEFGQVHGGIARHDASKVARSGLRRGTWPLDAPVPRTSPYGSARRGLRATGDSAHGRRKRTIPGGPSGTRPGPVQAGVSSGAAPAASSCAAQAAHNPNNTSSCPSTRKPPGNVTPSSMATGHPASNSNTEPQRTHRK